MLGGRDRLCPRLDYSFFNRGLAGKIAFSGKFYHRTGLSPDLGRIEEEQRKALASSVRAACIEVITRLVEDLRRRENLQEVCFAGGLFQNSLLVASLEKNLSMNQVFVPQFREMPEPLWERLTWLGTKCFRNPVRKP